MTEITDDELREKIAEMEIQLKNQKFMLDSTKKSIPEIEKEITRLEWNISDMGMTLKLRTATPDEVVEVSACPKQ